jgi:TROVE domain-containing protein
MKLNQPAQPTVQTHEGTPTKRLTHEQELRRTVLACMLWEDSFYESGESVADRIARLVALVPADKVAALAVEARERMKLRHVPLLLCRELARRPWMRGPSLAETLERVIQRPDELTEFLAIYWKEKRQPLAAQVKKGLARAFRKFSAHSLAKYDRDEKVKLRDVLFLTHARPNLGEQTETFKAVANRTLATPDTWEVALSAGADKRETWLRLMAEGKLGALALLRNLRNMQQAKVPEDAIRSALTAAKVDRVLPFRFIAAAKYAPTLEPELEMLMFRCLADAPKLAGRTALVVDTSPSMWQSAVSARSEMDRFEAAAALAMLAREACESVKVYAFNVKGYRVAPRRGFGLRDALASTKGNYSCGGLAVALANEDGYDRIIVLTDGQWHYSSAGHTIDREGAAQTVSPAPLTALAYMVNVAVYKNGVGYGKWTAIDGWSEAVLDFIREGEAAPVGAA